MYGATSQIVRPVAVSDDVKGVVEMGEFDVIECAQSSTAQRPKDTKEHHVFVSVTINDQIGDKVPVNIQNIPADYSEFQPVTEPNRRIHTIKWICLVGTVVSLMVICVVICIILVLRMSARFDDLSTQQLPSVVGPKKGDEVVEHYECRGEIAEKCGLESIDSLREKTIPGELYFYPSKVNFTKTNDLTAKNTLNLNNWPLSKRHVSPKVTEST